MPAAEGHAWKCVGFPVLSDPAREQYNSEKRGLTVIDLANIFKGAQLRVLLCSPRFRFAEALSADFWLDAVEYALSDSLRRYTGCRGVVTD
jgi:hypothetical protein